MPRRFLKQSAAAITREIAVLVYLTLAYLAYDHYDRVLKDAGTPSPVSNTPECQTYFDGSKFCILGR